MTVTLLGTPDPDDTPAAQPEALQALDAGVTLDQLNSAFTQLTAAAGAVQISFRGMTGTASSTWPGGSTAPFRHHGMTS